MRISNLTSNQRLLEASVALDETLKVEGGPEVVGPGALLQRSGPRGGFMMLGAVKRIP